MAPLLALLSPLACAPSEPEYAVGDPLPGLGERELARFRAGAGLFDKVFTPEEGVGPLFNENQCSACHTDPASGGTGEQLVLKATRFRGPGDCNLLTEEGGENVRVQATPLLRAHGIEREAVPASATETARFTTPFLFGLGLVEAIPDEDILSREDPYDGDGDGISGRAGRTVDGRLGRFSRKGEVATLREFTESALRFEMGLTTPAHPAEPGFDGRGLPSGTDPAPDPEITAEQLTLLTDFVRFLAPPPRRWPDSERERAIVAEGERLFARVGCTACHVPSMRTARSDIAALDRTSIQLYSDLLLHDLGPALSNVCGIAADPSELRTAPLMGLGHRRALLHDGRTLNLHEAILLHGGEAASARQLFRALGEVRQDAIIQFLRSL